MKKKLNCQLFDGDNRSCINPLINFISLPCDFQLVYFFWAEIPGCCTWYTCTLEPANASNTNIDHITWPLNYMINLDTISNTKINITKPGAFLLVNINFIFLLNKLLKARNILSHNRIPVAIIRTVIDIYSTHSKSLLMSTNPTVFNLNVQFRVI